MKRDRDDQVVDLGGRIKSLEQFSGTLVPRRERDVEADVIPIGEAPVARVPVPRRSRVFLRGSQGHGTFADLTLTAPRPRRAVD